MKTNIFKAAQDNWPEDEAYNLLCDWRDMEADESQRLHDQDHMIAVFNHEPDSEDLKRRFFERLQVGL